FRRVLFRSRGGAEGDAADASTAAGRRGVRLRGVPARRAGAGSAGAGEDRALVRGGRPRTRVLRSRVRTPPAGGAGPRLDGRPTLRRVRVVVRGRDGTRRGRDERVPDDAGRGVDRGLRGPAGGRCGAGPDALG